LTQLKDRKKDYVTESISPESKNEYLRNGWVVDMEFKNSIRVKKNKTIDVAFEDRVWSLFAQLEYDFLNKDRYFHVPYDKTNPELTQQIDVFVKDKETVLLIECKTAETNKRWDFKKELEAMASKIWGLKNTVNSLFPEGKPKIKYILVTKNLTLWDEDKLRLHNIWWIHFDEDNIDYFYWLYSQIWHACKYQLLWTLFDGQDIPDMENKVPAVQWKMGGFTYYSFCIEPEKILKIWYVLHRNKANINMMPTYQRIIKKTRLKSVEEFIKNWWYFPNSIVISIDSRSDLTFEQASNQPINTISKAWFLILPKRYRSAYIIDWQHRLYWYSNIDHKSKSTIPVVAFVNLSREDQIKLFMQINENQKAVSKDLRNTLNADLLWDSDNLLEQMRAICSRIAINLWESRSSALFNKVSIGEDKKIITTQAIENALKKNNFLWSVSKTKIEELWTIYDGDRNLDRTFEKIKEYLNLWFQYISENTKEEWEREDWMLLINKGIYAIIMILWDIITHLNKIGVTQLRKTSIKDVFNESKTYLDPIINYINKLDDETKNNLKSSYGAGWDEKYWRTFQKAIQDTHPDFSPAWLSNHLLKEKKQYDAEAYGIIREIEDYFKKDFRARLEEYYGERWWFVKWVPPNIAEKAIIDAMNKNRELEDWEDEIENWDCLTIIAYRAIATKNWQSIFEKEYTRPWEEGWNISKENKTKWMFNLEKIRNRNAHANSVTEEELSFLKEIYDWIVKKIVRNKYQLGES
jgi:DNA sulfur modification protein DndB